MAGRTSAANFAQDVLNPIFREGEDRVYKWLIESGRHVLDDRDKKTFHDFTIGHAWTLDVKVDQHAHRTGRVAWEMGVAMHSGRVREGWGLHQGLNYVMYVLLPAEDKRDGPWPFVLCNAQRLRDFALTHRETPLAEGFMVNGTDRDGFGFLLPLDALRQAGVVLQEGVLDAL